MKDPKSQGVIKRNISEESLCGRFQFVKSVCTQYCNHEVLRMSVSKEGLLEACGDIFKWLGKALLVLALSIACAIGFWYIRAEIANSIATSYKTYVVYLDSLIFGQIPSLWMQTNLRSDMMDSFLRWVWFTYLYSLIFGANLVYILRRGVLRYLVAAMLVLSIGLMIHYLIPTQPPWMSVEGVVRINGERFTHMDKNLMAAMPSIHQAMVSVVGCVLWEYGLFGKLSAISYNLIMAIALVYLGEHFVVDLIAGTVIALFSWYFSKQILILFDVESLRDVGSK
jgi:membrane-associated phospholipid phosphatase